MFTCRVLLALLVLACALPASAQLAVHDFALTACGAREPLFRSGLEAAEQPGVRASGGASDTAPGAGLVQVVVPDNGRMHRGYLQVPPSYSPQTAAPLVLVLHGAAGSPAAADEFAGLFRDFWANDAAVLGAVVLAPVASGNSGGWVPALDGPAIACLLAEAERLLNIDRSRRYLWGFSAGAHYAHALALGNAQRIAAYSVKAGAMAALACSPYSGVAACANVLQSASRRIPVQLRVGTSDPLQPQTTADLQSLQTAGWLLATDLEATSTPGGHEVLFEDASAARAWFAGRALP